ncbi:MAG: hypothetical protein M3Z24_00580, partial [Chloroflexota bacterium]|nr:hypothetical protein [Chloroflexota bacterium]
MKRFEQPTKSSVTQPLHTTTTTTTHPLGQSTSRRTGMLVPLLITGVALLVSAILVLTSTGLNTILPSSFFSKAHSISPSTGTRLPIMSNQVVGHVFFLSSGQIHQDTSQGIADEIQLDLNNIASSAPGKSYYAWLLSDDPVEGKPFLLGQLHVVHGTVHLLYTGDVQHTNLLEIADQVLITEEDAAITPSVPSPDSSTWKYAAHIPLTPNAADSTHHFSLLSHLRHLLASDPTLKSFGLPGGLDIWLFRNTQKILEWAGSARDDWAQKNTGLMHRQFIRILDYLDGLSCVQTDVPANTPVLTDPTIAKVGMLEFDVQHQEPPGYVYHIGLHLHGLIQAPGANADQIRLASAIDRALNTVQT